MNHFPQMAKVFKFLLYNRSFCTMTSFSKSVGSSSGTAEVAGLAADSFVWIDLELTGLELEKDTILEVACVVTNTQLEKLDKGIDLIINQPDEVLNSMNDWSRIQHAKSGLTFESKKSSLSLQEADKVLSEYIKKHANFNGNRYIAGNTVYMDKIFLNKYMPLSDSLLHYRIVDVSSLKTLCQNWYPSQFSMLPRKKLSHRAFDDILESINELKHLQKLIFK